MNSTNAAEREPAGEAHCHGFISANLAQETGFTTGDLDLLWEALAMMFDHDRSASRGTMAPQALLVFEHATPLGNAPAHKLFERVRIAAKPGITAARSFADYDLTIDDANLPAGIRLHRKL